ncbi:MAG: Ubiquitin carboxyl-terminal hydrolase [Rickettsiaceae bacterium]|jgi:hypothetical protein|nr:Ubiquitin carboxyl-terminal hydrolase [Rickettsiaceae bacterium]
MPKILDQRSDDNKKEVIAFSMLGKKLSELDANQKGALNDALSRSKKEANITNETLANFYSGKIPFCGSGESVFKGISVIGPVQALHATFPNIINYYQTNFTAWKADKKLKNLLEEDHNFIQVLFPTVTVSGPGEVFPVIEAGEEAAFRAAFGGDADTINKNLTDATNLMIEFFKEVGDDITPHNYLRISRMIESLGVVFEHPNKQKLVENILKSVKGKPGIGDDEIAAWKKHCHDAEITDIDGQKIDVFIDTLRSSPQKASPEESKDHAHKKPLSQPQIKGDMAWKIRKSDGAEVEVGSFVKRIPEENATLRSNLRLNATNLKVTDFNHNPAAEPYQFKKKPEKIDKKSDLIDGGEQTLYYYEPIGHVDTGGKNHWPRSVVTGFKPREKIKTISKAEFDGWVEKTKFYRDSDLNEETAVKIAQSKAKTEKPLARHDQKIGLPEHDHEGNLFSFIAPCEAYVENNGTKSDPVVQLALYNFTYPVFNTDSGKLGGEIFDVNGNVKEEVCRNLRKMIALSLRVVNEWGRDNEYEIPFILQNPNAFLSKLTDDLRSNVKKAIADAFAEVLNNAEAKDVSHIENFIVNGGYDFWEKDQAGNSLGNIAKMQNAANGGARKEMKVGNYDFMEIAKHYNAIGRICPEPLMGHTSKEVDNGGYGDGAEDAAEEYWCRATYGVYGQIIKKAIQQKILDRKKNGQSLDIAVNVYNAHAKPPAPAPSPAPAPGLAPVVAITKITKLPKKTDHTEVSIKVTPKGGKELIFKSLNLLNKCHKKDPKKPGSFTNNPFDIGEKWPEFEARKMAQIPEIITKAGDVFCFQETDLCDVPPLSADKKNQKEFDAKTRLRDAFEAACKKEGLGVIYSWDANTGGAHENRKLITLYKKDKFTAPTMADIKGVLPFTKEIELKDKKTGIKTGTKVKRVINQGLEVTLTPKDGSPKIKVTNMHLFDECTKADLDEYREANKSDAHKLVMFGDTNRPSYEYPFAISTNRATNVSNDGTYSIEEDPARKRTYADSAGNIKPLVKDYEHFTLHGGGEECEVELLEGEEFVKTAGGVAYKKYKGGEKYKVDKEGYLHFVPSNDPSLSKEEREYEKKLQEYYEDYKKYKTVLDSNANALETWKAANPNWEKWEKYNEDVKRAEIVDMVLDFQKKLSTADASERENFREELGRKVSKYLGADSELAKILDGHGQQDAAAILTPLLGILFGDKIGNIPAAYVGLDDQPVSIFELGRDDFGKSDPLDGLINGGNYHFNDPDEVVFRMKRFDFDKGVPSKDDRKIKFKSQIAIGSKKYKPTSFVVQDGNFSRGHYLAYVMDKTGQWWKYNDSQSPEKIGAVEADALMEEAYMVKYSTDDHANKIEKQEHGTNNFGSGGGNRCWFNAALAFALSFTSIEKVQAKVPSVTAPTSNRPKDVPLPKVPRKPQRSDIVKVIAPQLPHPGPASVPAPISGPVAPGPSPSPVTASKLKKDYEIAIEVEKFTNGNSSVSAEVVDEINKSVAKNTSVTSSYARRGAGIAFVPSKIIAGANTERSLAIINLLPDRKDEKTRFFDESGNPIPYDNMVELVNRKHITHIKVGDKETPVAELLDQGKIGEIFGKIGKVQFTIKDSNGGGVKKITCDIRPNALFVTDKSIDPKVAQHLRHDGKMVDWFDPKKDGLKVLGDDFQQYLVGTSKGVMTP